MDNETSNLFRETVRRLNIKVEYVPPDNHRQSPIERDIRTFKDHFIASLCTTDPDFPLSEWDLLLPQAEMTLNLMRGSKTKQPVSAYEHIHGPYSFERNPIAPIGTKVIIHESPEKRPSWSPHGLKGFYIGPAMEHYRSYRILVDGTRKIRVSDSVAWHPQSIHETPDELQVEQTSVESSTQTLPLERPTPHFNLQEQTTASEFVPLIAPSLLQSSTSAFGQRDNDVQIPDSSPLPLSPTTTQESISESESPTPSSRRSTRIRQPKRWYAEGIQKFAGMAHSYKSVCKGSEQKRWLQAAAEEFDRLIETTETMKFIPWDAKPSNRKASYYNPQIRIKTKPNGQEEYRVRGTYGGDVTDYSGPTSAQTADMISIKVLLNAVVSEKAKFMTIDIKDFYLGTPMDRKEYMKVHINQIPPASQAKYVKKGLVRDNSVLAEISKGIYGLTQAGLLAQEQLFEHLVSHDFMPISPENPCLLKHKTRDILFCLVVDDFGVKYQNKDDVQLLIDILNMKYKVKTDWSGSAYVGFKIDHDQMKGIVTLSMPKYIKEAVKRFNIDTSITINNPLTSQSESTRSDLASPASASETKRIQEIIGVLLYYSRAIDSTVLTRISKLSSEQAHPTRGTLAATERVLQYVATQPEASITFHQSDMRLICYSDASYLGETEARSRCGGFFYLGGKDTETLNGPIICRSSIIDVVTSSAAESEFAAAFMNAREAAYIRNILGAMGYQQEETPIITDNAFVFSVVNGTCKAKRSKSMDMRFYWLKDRVKRKQFKVLWCKGHRNISDHLTKDLPTQQLKSLQSFAIGNSERCRSVIELPSYKASRLGDKCKARGVCSSETETSPQDTIQPLCLPRTEA
jgi:hypothetical protein